MNIADVVEATGLHRNTVSAFYNETAQRLDLKAIDKLCELFDCRIGELLEYQPAQLGVSNSGKQQENAEEGTND